MARECRPPAREPMRSWLARRSTMATSTSLTQLPRQHQPRWTSSRNHYRIVRWDIANQFLIAQNDSANVSDPNRWTRIDWLKLNDMTPFEWAFCFTAYKATTRQEAESTAAAKRETPRTGCNGFPFSRMKRTP